MVRGKMAFPISHCWKIVPALFLQTCIFLATLKSIGVFFPALQNDLGISATDLGITLGLFDAFSFVPGSFVALLHKKSGTQRPLLVGGALLVSFGLISSTAVGNNVQLAVCLSVAGLGVNILSVTLGITLSERSGAHFDLLFGIGKSGYSLGMSVFPLLANYFMNIYGWRGSMLLIGAILSNVIPVVLIIDTKNGSFQRERESETRQLINDDGEQIGNDTGTSKEWRERTGEPQNRTLQESGRVKTVEESCIKIFCRIIKDFVGNSIFNRDRGLIVILTAYAIFSMIDGGWHAFLLPRAINQGLPTSKALYLAYTASIACFLGRCFSGIMLKPKYFTAHDWHMVLTAVNAVTLLVDVYLPYFGVKVVTSFMTALTIGERNILTVVICRDRAPLSSFPVILVATEIIFGVGAFVGTSLTGLTADAINYNSSFLMLAGFECLVLCLMIPPRRSIRTVTED